MKPSEWIEQQASKIIIKGKLTDRNMALCQAIVDLLDELHPMLPMLSSDSKIQQEPVNEFFPNSDVYKSSDGNWRMSRAVASGDTFHVPVDVLGRMFDDISSHPNHN